MVSNYYVEDVIVLKVINIKKKYLVVRISSETHKLINCECLKELLKYNPDLIGEKITQEFLIRRLALYYLDKIRPPNDD